MVALAVGMLVLASAELVSDRLLVRGVEEDSGGTLALSEALSLRPERAMRHRASLLVATHPSEALTLAQAAARRDPSPDAWSLVGQIAAAQNALEVSAEAYEESVRLYPWTYTGAANCAQVWDRLGDYSQALHWGNRARRLRPGDPRNTTLPF